MQGAILPTDYDWYEYLRGLDGLSEVNFWRPSDRRGFRAPEFSPFMFKLKAPHNAICGFGYFKQYTRLPIWLAWDAFERANGCESLQELMEKIGKLRPVPSPNEGTIRIGCIQIVEPTFFAREEWIQQPADWPPNIQSDKRYDLSTGEGLRVWSECLERVSPTMRLVAEPRSRYGPETTITPRLGQGTFRVAVSVAYDWGCAVSAEHSLPALDAAHIKAFDSDGPNEVSNGLLLRADIHRLFDRGYLTVTTGLELEVSSRLREDFANGRSYYPFHGQKIHVPSRPELRPSPEFLEWHNNNRYLG
ncbi:MAG: HNH endonuclease [Chloroflexi bacterium]|nr:HNH endonuclease [Chloroflexota bacterium]